MTELDLSSLSITRIDGCTADFEERLSALRRQLSPDGNVVSPKGKELTERVFGEPLLPAQVVERICEDVRLQGLSALARYSKELDGAEGAPVARVHVYLQLATLVEVKAESVGGRLCSCQVSIQ